jgi:hypothetical protein
MNKYQLQQFFGRTLNVHSALDWRICQAVPMLRSPYEYFGKHAGTKVIKRFGAYQIIRCLLHLSIPL